MEEKIFAILNDLIGVDPKETNRLIKRGITPGDFFLAKSVELDGNSFKVVVEVLSDGEKFEETLGGRNVSLYKQYDTDDVRPYNPLTDESLKSKSQMGQE